MMTAIPTPQGQAAWGALQALMQQRHIFAALEVLHHELGDVFQLPLPGFSAVMLVGPEANHFVLVDARDDLRWRAEHDPVTHLLRHGVLVEDGDTHDALRQHMNPSLHRNMLQTYVEAMVRCTDQVTNQWRDGTTLDMLVEMRRAALLILTDTLFKDDFSPHMQPLWQAVLRTLQYISPGMWMIWRGVPRPGYARALRQMDDYLYQLIAARRSQLGECDDLLGGLIATGMSDALIRDQLLTMLIAGHDTSTALLAWALYLLAINRDVLAQAQTEVDTVLGSRPPTFADAAQLGVLDRVVKETLRLYPPIHLGSRTPAHDLEFQGYTLTTGTRVLYSIYLSHRHPAYWTEPARFDPDRFLPENSRQRPPYVYLPFGGGARNCIGTAFAQVEAKIVLARILQQFDLESVVGHVRPRMKATLEPHPGVKMQVKRR
jgi:cytochrome P450